MEGVLKPETAEAIREVVHWAAAERVPLEVTGYGSRREIGSPVQAEYTLDLSAHSGITLYEPEELVIAAKAGTPLAEIRSTLAGHGQELAFEPMDFGPLFGAPQGRGTIGGVLAANACGPRRISAGAARDHALGISAVSGRGEIFKSGGRVVKNVTGYDLSRGLAGSWGTLAVVTDVTFKVLPAAESRLTFVLSGLQDPAAIAVLCAAMGSSATVSGAAHLPAPVAETLSGHFDNQLSTAARTSALTLIRLEGFKASVQARAQTLRHLFPDKPFDIVGGEESKALWAVVRDVQPFAGTDDVVWRVSVAPTAGPAVVAALREDGQTARVRAYYDWSGGLIWLAVPEADAGADGAAGPVRQAVAKHGGGHATLIRAPACVRAAIPVFQPEMPALAALSCRLKAAFDPHGILNPGRMSR